MRLLFFDFSPCKTFEKMTALCVSINQIGERIRFPSLPPLWSWICRKFSHVWATLMASSKISVKQIQWNKGNKAKQGRLSLVTFFGDTKKVTHKKGYSQRNSLSIQQDSIKSSNYKYPNIPVKIYPKIQDVITPINPGRMKLWLITNLPMWVVPERSNWIAAKSLG